MTVLLRRWHGLWQVADRSGTALGPEQARALVERWLPDPGAIEALRALLDPLAAHRLRDDELLDELALRIARGEILLLDERPEPSPSMPHEASAAEEAESEPASVPAGAPPPSESEPAATTCTNPACRGTFVRAASDAVWRAALADAAQAIVARERLTGRSAVVKRLRARHGEGVAPLLPPVSTPLRTARA